MEYHATIRHHSIARARIVPVGTDLTAAKRKATREFGDEQNGYTIVILEGHTPDYPGDIVARRRTGSRKWA